MFIYLLNIIVGLGQISSDSVIVYSDNEFFRECSQSNGIEK